VRKWPLSVRAGITALAVLLVAIVVVSVFRLIAARNELVRARQFMERGNTELLHGSSAPANQLYDAAHVSLARARSDAGFPASLLAPVPVVGSPVRAVRDAVVAGDDVVQGSRILAGSVAAFPIHGSSSIRGDDLGGFHSASGDAVAAIARARPYFDAAHRALSGPAHATLGWVSSPAQSLMGVVDGGLARVDAARNAFAIVQHLTDAHTTFRLLFVSLDTLEARPGGGYVGSFGILDFAHGTVKLEHYQSFENLHAAVPPLAPPTALADATAAPWGVENSMWWPSFPASARTAAELYLRQGGGHVDGVVGFTDDELGTLIGTVGPLQVAGYAPVTGDGFENRVLYETALKRPLDTPRKKFLVDTSRVLFDHLLHLRAALVPGVVDDISRGVGSGDVSLWFADPTWEHDIAGTDVAGALPNGRGDSIEVSEANVTGSKSNQDLVRNIDYEVHHSADGTYHAQLTIVYHDNGAPNAYLNPYYNGYVRIYVPESAKLDDAHSGDFNDAGIAPDGPFRVFAGYVLVKPQGQSTVRLDWDLPASIAPGGHYTLTWTRQTGTSADDASATVGDRTITLPGNQRVAHLSFDEGTNPVARWLHDRWVFRKLGL
jgi:hypothetical protein